MKKFGLWFVLGLLAFVLTACPAATEEEGEDITDIAGGDANLSTLVDALNKAGLVDDLQSAGPFTVFAPTNAAFTALLEAEGVADLDALIAKLGADTVRDILLYHVVNGKQRAADLTDGEELLTLQGEVITVAVSGSTVTLNGTAEVTTPNIEATNGVIHVIDEVLLPPTLTPEQDIVEVAQATPNLSTLVEALTAAELVDELQAPGPFTVFAPTNDAFATFLGEQGFADLEALIAELGVDAVRDILLYHVSDEAAFLSSDLRDGQTISTMQGQDIRVGVTEDPETSATIVTLNDVAQVITPNVEASNGIVHVIDSVLLPPDPGLDSTTYLLEEVGESGVSGTATFTKISDTETEINIFLSGVANDGDHPAHIHVGSDPPGGGIYISLANVIGFGDDTGDGQSFTTVTETDDGTPVTYEDLIAYDGYINIHLSAENLATVVAQGEIGAGATPALRGHKH
jgi:uncharacterized surface protein with fasciclin (FAS1) repeats